MRRTALALARVALEAELAMRAALWLAHLPPGIPLSASDLETLRLLHGTQTEENQK